MKKIFVILGIRGRGSWRMLFLFLLILSPACPVGGGGFSFSQSSRITWSSFDGGFGVSNSGNSQIVSSAGIPFTGSSVNGSSGILSGFLTNYSVLITGIKEEQKLIPTVYMLNQNFPNPFNPSTVISWQLPDRSHVSLKIYDILGNEVATLINENREAGYYETTFNASSLASGMYIYRLSASGRAGNYFFTRKMLMIK